MVRQIRGWARLLVMGCILGSSAAWAADPEPITYTYSVADAAAHLAHIEAVFPTAKAVQLDLMMPVWTPGYYRKEDYAGKVKNIAAKTAAGAALTIERKDNHWTATTNGESSIIVSYDLLADGRSVTANWVGTDMAVINGGSALITLAENVAQIKRQHRVNIELPSNFKNSISGLEAAPDNNPNHYVAKDFDTLADSPIVAGNIVLTEFKVNGIPHVVADGGDFGAWDSKAAAASIQKFVQANADFWAPVGGLPYKRYVFLNLFRQGGGGLEHMNSCLLTSSPRSATAGATYGFLKFVSHEYFHCYNVKRFRPIELGPFDYENPPSTPSLWISEGLTDYYGELMVTRGGLATQADWLGVMSGHIRTLQATPGRLKQTLEQASVTVWTGGSTSGVGGDTATTISYYGKGTVVGFVLDARIRHLTDGKKSLDDVMREGLKRYGAPKPGFTPEEFVALCGEIAGADMTEWFHKTLATTEELDYSEALDWYGLRFATPASAPASAPATAPAATGRAASTAYTLEIVADATAAQKAHLAAVTAADRAAG